MALLPKHRRPPCPECEGRNEITTTEGKRCRQCYVTPGWWRPRPDVPPPAQTAAPGTPLADDLQRHLKTPQTLADLSAACGVTPGQALDSLLALQRQGVNIHAVGERWQLEREPEPGNVGIIEPWIGESGTYPYRFGVVSDTHLCNKHARLDVLHDLYRQFQDAGIRRVYHAGNWLDGDDTSKNRYELLVTGMDPQIDYLAQEYPCIPDITTYAVAGDDHEGWFGQREGIDIGRHAQLLMERAGRHDWKHLGYVEAFIPLQHPVTGKQATLHVIHPGGGSSYAVSYKPQKLVEGYEGGEKPAIDVIGHYHKLEHLNTRNVHVIQAGCTEDLTTWAKKKGLRFEIGGHIVEARQDPETGAITSCRVETFQYFNRGYYTNGRWNYAGRVNHVPRVA